MFLMKYELLNCMFHVKTELYFHADNVRGDGAQLNIISLFVWSSFYKLKIRLEIIEALEKNQIDDVINLRNLLGRSEAYN